MLAFFFSLFLGFASADPLYLECDDFYLATNAKDRCRTVDCLCKVNPGKKSKNPQTSTQVERRYSVYFPNDVHGVTASEMNKARAYLSRVHDFFPSSKSSIIAYTDGCGSYGYNEELARRRLATANEVLDGIFPVDQKIIHPEASKECPSPTARRIDIVVHTTQKFTTMIDKVPADVYLLDASGSMWEGWTKWTDVINASYKPGSRIYLSITRGCYSGQTLNNVTPQGGTEIWYSYWRVLDFMKPGETLAIISDFQSEFALTGKERAVIESKVKDKGVRVIAIRP